MKETTSTLLERLRKNDRSLTHLTINLSQMNTKKKQVLLEAMQTNTFLVKLTIEGESTKEFGDELDNYLKRNQAYAQLVEDYQDFISTCKHDFFNKSKFEKIKNECVKLKGRIESFFEQYPYPLFAHRIAKLLKMQDGGGNTLGMLICLYQSHQVFTQEFLFGVYTYTAYNSYSLEIMKQYVTLLKTLLHQGASAEAMLDLLRVQNKHEETMGIYIAAYQHETTVQQYLILLTILLQQDISAEAILDLLRVQNKRKETMGIYIAKRQNGGMTTQQYIMLLTVLLKKGVSAEAVLGLLRLETNYCRTECMIIAGNRYATANMQQYLSLLTDLLQIGAYAQSILDLLNLREGSLEDRGMTIGMLIARYQDAVTTQQYLSLLKELLQKSVSPQTMLELLNLTDTNGRTLKSFIEKYQDAETLKQYNILLMELQEGIKKENFNQNIPIPEKIFISNHTGEDKIIVFSIPEKGLQRPDKSPQKIENSANQTSEKLINLESKRQTYYSVEKEPNEKKENVNIIESRYQRKIDRRNRERQKNQTNNVEQQEISVENDADVPISKKEFQNLDKRIRHLENNDHQTSKKITDIESNQQLVKKLSEELQLTLPTLTKQVKKAQVLQKTLSMIPQTGLTPDEIQLVKSWCEEHAAHLLRLEHIQDNPNLQAYYRRLQIRLEELFLGHKSRAQGLVDPSLCKASLLSAFYEALGKEIEKVPIIGLLPTLASKVNTLIATKKATQISKNISALGTFNEQQYLAQSIACYLTLRYQTQIKQLMTKEEMEAYQRNRRQHSTLEKVKQGVSKGVAIMKEELLTETKEPPCIEAAEFVMIFILLAFYDNQIKSPEQKGISVEEQIGQYLLKRLGPIEGITHMLLSKLGAQTVFTKEGQEWDLLEMYQKPGIETEEGDHYARRGKHKPKKYGYRQGTKQEVVLLNEQQLKSSQEMRDVTLVHRVVNLEKELSAMKKNSPPPNRNVDISVEVNGNQLQKQQKNVLSRNTGVTFFYPNSRQQGSNERLSKVENQVTLLTEELVVQKETTDKLQENQECFLGKNSNPLPEDPLVTTLRQKIVDALLDYLKDTQPKKQPTLFLFISPSDTSLELVKGKVSLAEDLINELRIAKDLYRIKAILEAGIREDAVLCQKAEVSPNTLTTLLEGFLTGQLQSGIKVMEKGR